MTLSLRAAADSVRVLVSNLAATFLPGLVNPVSGVALADADASPVHAEPAAGGSDTAVSPDGMAARREVQVDSEPRSLNGDFIPTNQK